MDVDDQLNLSFVKPVEDFDLFDGSNVIKEEDNVRLSGVIIIYIILFLRLEIQSNNFSTSYNRIEIDSL